MQDIVAQSDAPRSSFAQPLAMRSSGISWPWTEVSTSCRTTAGLASGMIPKVMQKPLPDERLFVFTGSYKVFSNNAYCLSTTAPIASRLFLSTWFESRIQLISQAS